MMPNIVRGDRMSGVMVYLVGPGRANEHTEPHLVAGDTALMAWHDDNVLSRDSALSIAHHLDRPHTAHGVDVPAGIYEKQRVFGEDGLRRFKPVKVGERDAHVWHCSLSLRADEGMLSDEKWGEVVTDFVRAMEFDDNEGTKAPCRWAAVRHGVSKNGNDHVHLVVDLVREDGTKASVHYDQIRAQKAARVLEAEHGLEELESVTAERSTRGYDPAEREAQARSRARAKYEKTRLQPDGVGPSWEQLGAEDRQQRIADEMRTDQPRYLLSLKVRAAAEASQDEAEYIRRLRRTGLIVRPRYADGRTDVIEGYSVAERPVYGERPIWYGGGRLGHDLTLPRLREAWPDTPMGASEAADEWNAAKRGRRVVAPGRETRDPAPEDWQQRTTQLHEVVERLRSVPVEDRKTWATVARQTAGALAAWSNATEATPGDLGAAADALSRSAQTFRPTPPPQKTGTSAVSDAAMLLSAATRGGRGTVAEAVMIRQMLRLTQAVYDASVAAGQTRHAQHLAQDTRARLVRVREALPAPAADAQPAGTATAVAERPTLDPEEQAMLDRVRAGNARSATEPVSPVPSRIEPRWVQQPTQPGTDRGPER